MSKVKIIKSKKSKEIMSLLKDEEMLSSFNRMLGAEAGDPEIVRPRYILCKNNISILSMLMNKFGSEKMMHDSYPSEKSALKELVDFSEKLRETIDDKPLNYKYETENISVMYVELKKKESIRMLFAVHTQLREYKPFIENANNLTGEFVYDEPGFEVYPFRKISELNLFNIWSTNPSKDAKMYILKFLHRVYSITKTIVETIMLPDIDIDMFSKKFITYITELKKQIPRCDEAFKKIESAIGLLKKNFNCYYRDFVRTENPSVIVDGLLNDVINENKRNIKLSYQLKKILMYFQKSMTHCATPKIKNLMNSLLSNLNVYSE